MNIQEILMALSYVVQERGEGDPIVSVEKLEVEEGCTGVKVTVVSEMETEVSMLVCINTGSLALSYLSYMDEPEDDGEYTDGGGAWMDEQ